MKNWQFWCIVVLCVNYSFSQQIQILDSKEHTAIAGAHVLYRPISSDQVKMVLSDEHGKVQFENNLKYPLMITIKSMGYKSVVDTLYKPESKVYFLENDVITLNEVVVTAQYAPNSPEKSVHKIKVIDQKKIEAMGAQNLRDVLTNEMNIRLSQDNVLGSGMSLQGITGQNVKILIDGVPVIGRLDGNIDLSQINMNNVERIEIVEGPLSVNYGTDALAGTINIITKKSQKNTWSVTSTNYYESIGNYNFTGRIGYRHKKSNFALSGGRNYFDGWRPTDNPFRVEKVHIADSSRYMSWKPKEQIFGAFQYGRSISQLMLTFKSDFFYENLINKGYPRAPYGETAFDDYYRTYRSTSNVALVGKISKNFNLNFMAAYSYYKRVKNSYYNDLTTLEEVLTTNSGDQDTTYYTAFNSRASINSRRDSAQFNYEIGYDVQIENGFGVRFEGRKKQIGDYALFATAEYKPFEKLIIRPGIRFIYNTSYKAPVVPSVNFKYQLGNNTTLRLSYARGFRSPDIKELYFYFIDANHDITGNADLKAENSNNVNLAISDNRKIGKNFLKSEISFYYNQIENMITLAQSGSGTSYSYFNVDHFRSVGTQAQVEIAIKHLKLTAGGALIGRYNQYAGETNSETMFYSPEGKFNAFYEWKKQQMTFALFYKYTGVTPSIALDDDGSPYLSHIAAYNTMDLTVSKAFFNRILKLSIGCKNLFNVTTVYGSAVSGAAHETASTSTSVGTGRSYFMRLEINLNSKK